MVSPSFWSRRKARTPDASSPLPSTARARSVAGVAELLPSSSDDLVDPAVDSARPADNSPLKAKTIFSDEENEPPSPAAARSEGKSAARNDTPTGGGRKQRPKLGAFGAAKRRNRPSTKRSAPSTPTPGGGDAPSTPSSRHTKKKGRWPWGKGKAKSPGTGAEEASPGSGGGPPSASAAPTAAGDPSTSTSAAGTGGTASSSGAGGGGFAFPKNQFLPNLRPVTFGRQVSGEEVYDLDDMEAFETDFALAVQLQFNPRSKGSSQKKAAVKEGLLSNNRRCLSRLHVEDMMQQHSVDGEEIQFRVFLAKDSNDTRWARNADIYRFQRDPKNELGLGVQRCTIMKRDYFELYATLVPNERHRQMREGTLPKKEIQSLYNGDGGFELRFVGMPAGKDVMQFRWEDMVDKAEELLIFGAPNSTSRNYLRLFNDKAKRNYLHHIFRQFAHETRGDALAATALQSAYYQKLKIVVEEDMEKDHERQLEDVVKRMQFVGKKKSEFFEKVDRIFETALKKSMAEFQDYTLALVELETLTELMEEMESLFPAIWKGLCAMRNINPNFAKGKDLVRSKQLQVFFQILACARQADARRLVYWSMVQSLACYGWGVANKAQNFCCYWGNSCHPVTRDKKLKEMMTDLLERHIELMSKETGLVLVYDNYQRGQQLRHQRNKSSSDFVKGTHQLACKLHVWDCKSYDGKRVAMTYVDQAIPSPSGMPAFELVDLDCPTAVSAQLEEYSRMVPETEPDFDGKRVKAYLKLRRKAFVINEVWRCFVSENVCPDSGVFDDAKIQQLHDLVTSELTNGLFEGAKHFVDKAVECWHPRAGDVTLSLLLGLLGISEESAEECGAISLDQLYRVGILVEKKDGTWELAPDWEERRIYLYGDCKTIENVAKFVRDVAGRPLSYDDASRQADIFMDAMSVVMQLPGDWHAGLAMLQSIYSLFYGGLLEPFQKALGMKNIGIDVRNCYFQASRLAGMVADELVRALMYEFASSFEAYAEGSDAAVFVCKFAAQWDEFLLGLKTSDDEWRRACALFLIMYQDFRLFVEAYRHGDTPAILDGYSTFAPRWHKLKQYKYIERTWHQMEQLFRDHPYSRYMEACQNRCVRKYAEEGRHMTALDEYLENKNAGFADFQKVMNMVSFMRQGVCVGPAERCKRTVTQFYKIGKQFTTEVYGRSIAPSMVPEKQFLFEMVMLLKTCEENVGRKLTVALVDSVKGQTKTKLKRDEMEKRKNDSGEQSYNRLFSSLHQILSNEREAEEHTSNLEADEGAAASGDGNSNGNTATRIEDIDEDALMGPLRANLDTGTPAVALQSVDERTKRHKLHELALKDVQAEGNEYFGGQNLSEVRDAAQQRAKRQREVNREILSAVRRMQQEAEYGRVQKERNDLPVQPWRKYLADRRRASGKTRVMI